MRPARKTYVRFLLGHTCTPPGFVMWSCRFVRVIARNLYVWSSSARKIETVRDVLGHLVGAWKWRGILHLDLQHLREKKNNISHLHIKHILRLSIRMFVLLTGIFSLCLHGIEIQQMLCALDVRDSRDAFDDLATACLVPRGKVPGATNLCVCRMHT